MAAQVSLLSCNTYDDDQISSTITEAVDLIGGIGEYVKAGSRVLIKPNLVLASTPDEAICTHPSVVKAVVQLVQLAGAVPIIGESPGGPFNRAWLWAIYRRSGMVQVAQETGAELNWEFGYTYQSYPDGRTVKGLEIADYADKVDTVISLPKLKTHGLMQLSGATKNLFGVIPGTLKTAYHAKFPDPVKFAGLLIDLLEYMNPALTIMDAVIGMDGLGPTAGTPFEIGAILASADPVALDVVAGNLVGMDTNTIYPLQVALERDLWDGEISSIDVLGSGLASWDIQGFQTPGTRTRRRRSLATLAGGIVKNQMTAKPGSTDNCIGCGICARACPAEAITIVEKRAVMDHEKCIRCYCCHELCPEHAVELRKPFLARLLGA